MRRDTCGSLPSWAACLVAVTACAGPATAPEDPSVYSNPYIEALAEALGERRLFEPRLTGGFAWAPCEPPGEDPEDLIPSARCGELPEPGTVQGRRLLAVWREIIQAVNKRGETAELLHARGVGHLLWSARGDELELERAVDDLKRAAELSPEGSAQRAAVLSDLAAAYLVRAGWGDEPADLARGLEFAAQAVETNGRLPEPWANLALVRERLFLRTAAQEAWAAASSREADPSWSGDVDSHLERLSQPTADEQWRATKAALESGAISGETAISEVAAAFPQQVREWGEQELLGLWAQDRAEGRFDDAQRVLTLTGALAGALVETGGDALLVDAVTAILEAAQDAFGGHQLDTLTEGHRLFATALAFERSYDSREAERALEGAREAFSIADSPFLHWVDLHRAIALFRQKRLSDARDLLRQIAEELPTHYSALAGRIEWIAALANGTAGLMDPAQAALERAAERFGSVGETGNVASVRVLQADLLTTLHQADDAWPPLYQALSSWEELDKRRRRHTVLTQAAVLSENADAPRAALDFYKELLALEEMEPNATDSAQAHLERARLLSELGLLAEAGTDVEASRDLARQIPEGPTRHRVEAGIAMAEAGLLPDPGSAVRSLTRAIDFYQVGDRQFELPRLYRARAHKAIAAGDAALAEADLRKGLDVVDGFLATLSDVGQLSPAAREATLLAEDLVGLLARDESRAVAAFEVAERAQSRALQELLRRKSPTADANTLTASEILHRLPEDVALIEYAVLEDRLLAWVLRAPSTFQSFTVPISRSELERRVRELRRVLQEDRPDSEATAAGGSLYEVILGRLADSLDGAGRLVFVPDEVLGGVPYGALVDPVSQETLSETWVSSVAPTAGMYLRAVDRAQALAVKGGQHRTALVVGAPERADADLFPALPYAEEEARKMADLLETIPLIGQEATKQRFLTEIQNARIVHFAGHAHNNPNNPGRSFLALASETGRSEDGNLYAAEIAALDLSRTEVVVLSACETAGDGRGLPLAWAFLAAGVPTVLATLWEVEDRWLYSNFQEPASGRGVQALLTKYLARARLRPRITIFGFAFGGTNRVKTTRSRYVYTEATVHRSLGLHTDTGNRQL